MQESTLAALQAMRPQLVEYWQGSLRQQPVRSALGTPEALFYLMDWTLSEVFKALRSEPHRRRLRPRSKTDEEKAEELCACGLNPLLTYFACLEKVLSQALDDSVVQVTTSSAGERGVALDEVRLAVAHVAQREIETFCAVCQRHPHPPITACQPCIRKSRTSGTAP